MIELNFSLTRGAFTLELSTRLPGSGVIALLGPSGCGKSTLASTLAGLIAPEAGRIVVNDVVFDDVTAHLHRSVQDRGIGFLFQSHRLFPHLSVRDNLFYGQNVAHRSLRVKSECLIDTLGIGPLLSRRADALSGGESQRVALGRALLASQNLLILDEPLSSLDSERREELLHYLERVLALTDLPVLYITHAEEEAKRLAHTIMRLKAGRLYGELDTNEPSYSPLLK